MVGPLVKLQLGCATVADGPVLKVTVTTEIEKVREGAKATAEVSNQIIVLLQ